MGKAPPQFLDYVQLFERSVTATGAERQRLQAMMCDIVANWTGDDCRKAAHWHRQQQERA